MKKINMDEFIEAVESDTTAKPREIVEGLEISFLNPLIVIIVTILVGTLLYFGGK